MTTFGFWSAGSSYRFWIFWSETLDRIEILVFRKASYLMARTPKYPKAVRASRTPKIQKRS
jgi:hypothetical protein